MNNRGSNSGYDGGMSIPQRRSPSGAQGRMAWRTKNRYDENDATLYGLVGDLIGTEQHLILHAKNIGAWLNVQGTTVTGIVLLAT